MRKICTVLGEEERTVCMGRGTLLLNRDCKSLFSVFLGSFQRRKRNSLYVTVTLLIVSVLILTVGLAATTRTQNVTVGGYYPGAIVSIEPLGRWRNLWAHNSRYGTACTCEHFLRWITFHVQLCFGKGWVTGGFLWVAWRNNLKQIKIFFLGGGSGQGWRKGLGTHRWLDQFSPYSHSMIGDHGVWCYLRSFWAPNAWYFVHTCKSSINAAVILTLVCMC